MFRISIVCGLLLFGGAQVMAQSYDEERMERDLKVAENILSTLSNDESVRWIRDNVESNYIPGYGVIFTMPMQSVIYSIGAGNVSFSTGSGQVIVIDDEDDDEDGEVDVRTDVIIDEKVRARGRGKSRIDIEELAQESELQMIKQISTFLIDYADLIGQLKPTDRIVVQVKDRRDMAFYKGLNRSKGSPNLSGQVVKEDLIAYRQGKISRDEAMKRIEFNTGDEKPVAKDIELFASIFGRLFEPDISTTYYASSRHINFSVLENLGVTFSMRFYSSTSDSGLHTIRTTGESGLTQEERNKKVESLYPEFEKTFKENLIDYGRTIRSLEPNEMILFKVRLTECKGCNMPEEIEVSVKGKTLADYDTGKIDRRQALSQVVVKKK
ncbi:MAG: hypothetical protein Tsb0034_01270 [Ekhidna sp.]